jgi:hypothetical protein
MVVMPNYNDDNNRNRGNGLFAVLFAPVIGMFLVWWCCSQSFQTEAHAVRVEHALSLGSKDVQALNDGNAQQMQNKLAYFTGPAALHGDAKDTETGVRAPVVRLMRHVEMFQWQEEQHDSGRHHHYYTYYTGWSSSEVNSNNFHNSGHSNPHFPFGSRGFNAPCTINNHEVPSDLLDKLPAVVPLYPIPPSLDLYRLTGDLQQPCRRMGQVVYVGNNPNAPAVGDMKIRYTAAPVGALSIVASESNKSFSPYYEANGESIFLIEPGTVPVQKMFKDALDANQVELWGKRLAWFILSWIGLMLMWAPVKAVLDWIPFFGSTLADLIIIPVTLIGALFINGIIIIASWFVLRPMFSLCMFGGLMVLGLICMNMMPRQQRLEDVR